MTTTQTPPPARRKEAAADGLLVKILVPPWVRRRRAAAKQPHTKSSRITAAPTTRVVAGRADPRTGGQVGFSPGLPSILLARTSEKEPVPDVIELGTKPGRVARVLGWASIEEPAIFTSTRQAEALNPALVATHPPMAGPPQGLDVLTNNMISADPHLLYAQKRTTSPHWVVLGELASGKTSFKMTVYVVRQVAMGKQVAVFDRKRQQEHGGGVGGGEYEDAAKLCGGEVIRFSRRGGKSLNLLDPRIAMRGDNDEVVGQDELLILAAEYAHGPLDSKERAALAAAHGQALRFAKNAERVATIHDVIEALFEPEQESIPHPSLAARGLVDVNQMTNWGLDLAMDLQRFVRGDLSGLVDADTSTSINWDAPLLVFDTSDLAPGSPALSLVTMLVTTFLSSVWAAKPALRVIGLEEGYDTASLGGSGAVTVAGMLRSLLKRGRGIGLSFGIVIHHISDIPADSEAVSLIKEAGIIHVYRQDKQTDIDAVLTEYGFPADIAEDLKNLDQGVQIIRIANEAPRMMRHVRSTTEVALTDSDAAMEGRAKLNYNADTSDELGL